MFQCLPDVFNLWYKAASEAKDKPLDPNADKVYEDDVFESPPRRARRVLSAELASGLCAMGLDRADPAVANHWMKADSSLEAATGALKL